MRFKNLLIIIALGSVLGWNYLNKESNDVISISERSILINNENYFVKGVCYHPVPKGSSERNFNNIDKDLSLMVEAGINDGDTVIIKKASNADNGQIAVVLIDDQEATLKRIRRKGNTIALEAANKNYDTKIYAANRIKIQGKLVSLYRNFH